MKIEEVCQIIRRMIDSGEPDSVYIPLPVVHEFDRMMQTDSSADVVAMFGPEVASAASQEVSFRGRLDIILMGYLFGLLNGCTYTDTGMYLSRDQAKLFVKMLANPEIACIAQRYICGSSLDGDEELIYAWKENLP